MTANAPPTLLQRSASSFATLAPGALATWLMPTNGFTEQVPMANEAYRLTTDGMVVAIFTYGLVLAEGRNMAAAVLLLSDLCATDGGAM